MNEVRAGGGEEEEEEEQEETAGLGRSRCRRSATRQLPVEAQTLLLLRLKTYPHLMQVETAAMVSCCCKAESTKHRFP